ncbi:hypothetical protein AC578_11128 [Pseudocercospora eumusae]|uniref:Fatty acid hydroxylase domain-containing protein n=1 Tax=Pseudocercospora eumusae TaxID=321146 RepID=A0A139H280_9PEZI|nr:hypothetical protein AC578_11128 [Pseudocercospora eumusae]
MVYADRRPTDSMKSTWRKDPSQWRFPHRFLNAINAFHKDLDQEPPKHAKTDRVPYMTEWSCHVYILLHAAWPMMIQQFYMWYYRKDMHPIAAFLLYTTAMQLNSIRQVRLLKRLGMKYGYLDGDKHDRDDVPDNGVGKVLASLELTTTIRPMIAVFLAFRRSTTGLLSLSWWLPVELFLYSLVLDGWFYLYHRSSHEIDALWKIHRTHHMTKHPSPLLSSYADSEQEFIEIALVPFLTWAVLKFLFQLPMGFHDWWICHEYIIFTEAFGHSGLRIYSTTPTAASWLLKLLDCELAIEDHDLHHRKGWRKSQNYGKQTRLWDRLFGTSGHRIEVVPENVDFEGMRFHFPFF